MSKALVVDGSANGAAYYENDRLVFAGDHDEVCERILERLSVDVEQVKRITPQGKHLWTDVPENYRDLEWINA